MPAAASKKIDFPVPKGATEAEVGSLVGRLVAEKVEEGIAGMGAGSREEVSAAASELALELARLMGRAPLPEKWLSREQAAEYLGVNSRTIDQSVHDGILACHRMGRSIRFVRADLDALFKRIEAVNKDL